MDRRSSASSRNDAPFFRSISIPNQVTILILKLRFFYGLDRKKMLRLWLREAKVAIVMSLAKKRIQKGMQREESVFLWKRWTRR